MQLGSGQLCLDAGADDVGFVERDRPEIADQKADIHNVFPRTRTLISVVCRLNRENIRTPARSISNLEFHHTTDETNWVIIHFRRASTVRRCDAIVEGTRPQNCTFIARPLLQKQSI
jgi:hypothetical protein